MLTALVFSTYLQIGSCLKSEGHNSTCCSKFWIAGDIQQVSHEGQMPLFQCWVPLEIVKKKERIFFSGRMLRSSCFVFQRISVQNFDQKVLTEDT